MKPMYYRINSLVLALLAAFSIARADNPTDFTVESVTDGSKLQLSKQKGKVVALHFLLKTECPFCLKYTHDYAVLSAKTPDVVHVFLKPDSPYEIKAWAKKISPAGISEMPQIFRDPEAKLAKQYEIPDGYKFHGQFVHYPALIVLDGSGHELFRYVGKDNSDRLPASKFEAKLAESKSK